METDGVGIGANDSKFAFTDFAESIVTEQVKAEPEQSPDQPVKLDLMTGITSRVTTVPDSNSDEQTVSQADIPAGFEETDPPPDPVRSTVRVCFSAA